MPRHGQSGAGRQAPASMCLVVSVFGAGLVLYNAYWSSSRGMQHLRERASDAPTTTCKGGRSLRVVSHRGAFAGSMPGSAPAMLSLQAAGVCSFDLDVSKTADGSYVIGHPVDLERLLEANEAITVEQALATVLTKFSGDGHCSGKSKDGETRLFLEMKGTAVGREFVRLLSSLHKAMGGWPRGAVALWVQDRHLAAFAREQLDAGALKLMYPIKGKTGLSSSDIRHDFQTVDSREDACRLSAAGVTTVISNVPMVLQEQLRSFQAIS